MVSKISWCHMFCCFVFSIINHSLQVQSTEGVMLHCSGGVEQSIASSTFLTEVI